MQHRHFQAEFPLERGVFDSFPSPPTTKVAVRRGFVDVIPENKLSASIVAPVAAMPAAEELAVVAGQIIRAAMPSVITGSRQIGFQIRSFRRRFRPGD